MQKRHEWVQNKQGNALQGVTVTVRTYPGLALASIYSSNGSGLIGGSYVTSDAQGYYEYYAADGRYTEVVTGPGIETYTVNDISIEDSEADFTALAASSGSSLVGFIQSGTGAVAEALQSRERWVVNLTDFMSDADRAAIRAGTTTDITTALTNALASLPSTGGDVNMPQVSAALKIVSSITLSSGQRLVGAGYSASFGGANGGTTILKTGNFDGIVLNAQEAGLIGIHVRGDTGNGGDGIYVRGAHCLLRDVSSNDHAGVGIRIGDKTAASANCNHIQVENIKVLGNTLHGMYLEDANAAANVNAGFFANIDARDNGGDGIRIGNAYDNTFIMPSGQNNTGYGMRCITGAKGNFVFFPYTETNTAGTIILDAGSQENCIFGARQGTADGYTDNGTRNTLVGRDNGKQGDLIWKKLWAVEQYISNASYTGRLKISQTATDVYEMSPTGGANADLVLKNASGTLRVKINALTGYYKGVIHRGATINHGTVGANTYADATVTVTGARDNMKVVANPRQAAAIPAGLVYGGAWVSADDTVTIRLGNLTGVGVASNIAWTVAVFDILDS